MAPDPAPRPTPDMSSGPEVICDSLAMTFGAGREAVEALAPTDLRLKPGTMTALVGPSGCGKSTLLRLIAGLDSPTAGEVSIDGQSPDKIRKEATLAVAFQDPSLLPWRTVRGNVALARRLARMPADPDKVDGLIARVGLAGFEDRRPAELSGGMRQRAAIARCLATDPTLLLLDEPFGAVDELTRRRLNVELPRLWDAGGVTGLLVTHSVHEAVLLADRVLVMSPRPGRIVADLPVALPRPRGPDTPTLPGFTALTGEVAAHLSNGSEGAAREAAE